MSENKEIKDAEARKKSNAVSVPERSVPAKVGRFIFGFNMAMSMLVSAAIIRIVMFMPLSQQTKEATALRCIQFFWRICLFLSSPWIPITWSPGSEEDFAVFNKCLEAFEATKGRPVFILGNHTSFLDTILTVAQLPMHAIGRARTYMGAHLYNMPILSTICKGCGHFPVYFKSDDEGKFAVDKEKMAKVTEIVDTHIQENGVLCFFPEGTMNPTPNTIMPLRYGGINKALEFDAALFSFISCGNEHVWPKRTQIGGFPASIGLSMKAVAPQGTKKMLVSIRKDKKEAECGCDSSTPDHVLLSKYLQMVMQRQHDDLLEMNGGAKRVKAE